MGQAVVAAVVLALTAVAGAIVVEVPVRPDYVKEKPSAFSVEAERKEDGLIHFTFTRRLPRPTYVVTRLIGIRETNDVVRPAGKRDGVAAGFAANERSANSERASGRRSGDSATWRVTDWSRTTDAELVSFGFSSDERALVPGDDEVEQRPV